MPERIAVIVTTTRDRRAYVEVCLDSMASERSEVNDLSVIVIGNGSDPEIDESDWVESIVTDRPMALAATHNLGLDRARERGCTSALILNDDTKVKPGMFAALVEAMHEHPRSLMTPVQLEMDNDAAIDKQAMAFVAESKEFVGDTLLGRPPRAAYPTPSMVGASIFAKMDVFNELGPFDELYTFYCVDDDYCARAEFHGVELLIVPRARLEHMHGRFQDNPNQNAERWFYRWRTHQQGRIILHLKRHDRSLFNAYVRELVRVSNQSMSCLVQRWPRGFVTLLVDFARLTLQLPRIAKHRREHYA